MTASQVRGQRAFHAGLSAEEQIARDYEQRGFTIVHKRWRCGGGEIDLIARGFGQVVFVEVKQRQSIDRAAVSLTTRQISRIFISAAMYLDNEPSGQLTNSRFDVALVDGSGRFEIIESAIDLS